MDFRLLGTVEIDRDGSGPVPGPPRQRAVLACLLVEAGQVVPVHVLLDRVWDQDPPPGARRSLHSYLTRIRRLLEQASGEGERPTVEHRSGGYVLTVDPDRVDLHRFGDLVRRSADPCLEAAGRIRLLREALALWRGEALSDVNGQWAERTRGRLEQDRLAAVLEWARAELESGDPRSVIGPLTEFRERHPFTEPLVLLIMQALRRVGRSAEALDRYGDFRRFLAEELGADPGPQLVGLHRTILRERGPCGPAGSPAPADPAAPAVRGSGPAGPARPEEAPCPFPGLRAHGEEEARAGFYRGRDDLVDEIVRRLGARAGDGGPLIVMGPSGVGKTSLLRAGLLPALAAGRVPVPGSRSWTRCYLRPGTDPVAELATALAPVAGVPPQDLAQRVREDPSALGRALRSAARRAVLVVDQFEELFTCGCDEEDRWITVRALLGACEGGGAGPAPAVAVIGVRADFCTRLLSAPELAPYLQRDLVVVGPLNGRGLREAIEGPAAAAGLRLQPGLVETLMLETEPESLPLLAHALRQTFAHRQDGELTIAGYRAAGGIDRALATTADALHDGLPERDRPLLRALLVRLVCVNDGVDDARRRVDRQDLLGSDPRRRRRIECLLGRLVECRLVTAERDSYTISHEALLRSWPRLRRWLDEDRTTLQLRHELAQAAAQWRRLDHDQGVLYRGTRLAMVRQWVAGAGPESLSGPEEDFIGASAVAEQLEERAARNRIRLARSGLAAMASLLMVASAAAGSAVQQWREASLARDVAGSQRLAAQATALMDSDPDLGALLAVRAYRTAGTPEALQQVRTAALLPLRHRLDTSAGVLDAAFGPDGQTLVTAGDDGVLRLWNPATGRAVSRIDTGGSAVTALAVRPGEAPGTSGGRAAAGSASGTWSSVSVAAASGSGPPATVWSVPSGRVEAVAPGSAGARHLVYSPDGEVLAVVDRHGRVSLLDASTGRVCAVLGHAAGANGAPVFSPDGRRLVTGDGRGVVRIWDVATGRLLRGMQVLDGAVHRLVLDPDGRFLVCCGRRGELRVRDLGGSDRFSLRTQSTGPVLAAFSPSGDRLVVAGNEGVLQVWSVGEGGFALSRTGRSSRTGRIRSLEFGPDGRSVLTAGQDGTATLWDAGTAEVVTTLTGHRGPVSAARFSPDGRMVVTASDDGTARLWNTRVEQAMDPLAGHAGGAGAVSWSPDGRYLATGGQDGTSRIRDAGTGRLLAVLHGDGPVRVLAFDPAGGLLATGGPRGTVRLWEVPSGTPLGSSRLPGAAVGSLSFSGDGRMLAAGGSDGSVRRWRTAGNRLVELGGTRMPAPGASVLFRPGHPDVLAVCSRATASFLDAAAPAPDPGSATAPGGTARGDGWNAAAGDPPAAFTPDGALLACGSPGNGVRVVRADAPGHPVDVVGGTGRVEDLAVSPDGARLATAGDDGTVRIWDARTGGRIATLAGHVGPVRAVGFSPDGATVATAGDDGTIRVWDAATGSPLTRFTGHAGPVRALAFAPDSSAVATASDDGTVRVWRVPPDALPAIRRICSAVGRDLTGQERAVHLPGDRHGRAC